MSDITITSAFSDDKVPEIHRKNLLNHVLARTNLGWSCVDGKYGLVEKSS